MRGWTAVTIPDQTIFSFLGSRAFRSSIMRRLEFGATRNSAFATGKNSNQSATYVPLLRVLASVRLSWYACDAGCSTAGIPEASPPDPSWSKKSLVQVLAPYGSD